MALVAGNVRVTSTKREPSLFVIKIAPSARFGPIRNRCGCALVLSVAVRTLSILEPGVQTSVLGNKVLEAAVIVAVEAQVFRDPASKFVAFFTVFLAF